MTLQCFIPEKKANEFRFVIDIVFNEFLGVSCVVNERESNDYVEFRYTKSTRKLRLKNEFLQRNIERFSQKNLPKLPLKSLELDSFSLKSNLKELPVLFGTEDVYVDDDSLELGIDILGGVFFLLSRYEELVINSRDAHDRFPAFESIAYKAGFLNKPVVDEYVEFLWECLTYLWPSLTRKKCDSRTYISCDVDQPFDHTVQSSKALIKTCIADIVKRKSVIEVFKRVRRYLYNYHNDYQFDPFYTFDWYMSACEAMGFKVVFYFIPTSIEPKNGNYELSDKGIERLLINISSRGHEIGVHGSYQTYLDGNKVLEQKRLLENTLSRLGIEQLIKGNRQHYLRWDSSVTPELLDQAGFQYDTTGGYADHGGFRYGTAREFSMWGWQSKKKLTLKQRPLIAMECSLIDESYMNLGKGVSFFNYLKMLNCTAKQHGGNFSLLWHNSSLVTNQDKKLFTDCVSILDAEISQ